MPRTWRSWALPLDHPRLRDRIPAPHSADELPAVPVRGSDLQQLPEHRHDGGDGHLRDDGRGPEHGRRLRGPPRPRLRGVLRARRVHGGLARLAARIAVHPRREADRRQYRRHRCDGGTRWDPHLDLGRSPRRCDRHGRGRNPHRPADAAAAWRLPRDRHTRVRGDHRRGRAQRRQRDARLQPHERTARHQPDRPSRIRRMALRPSRAAGQLSSTNTAST